MASATLCRAFPREREPEMYGRQVKEVDAMTIQKPTIGGWYCQPGGALFEVVAYDDDDGTIEIQYFDGTIEELEREDWNAQWKDGSLETGEAPEDWSGSVDGDPQETGSVADSGFMERDLHVSPLEGLDRIK